MPLISPTLSNHKLCKLQEGLFPLISPTLSNNKLCQLQEGPFSILFITFESKGLMAFYLVYYI